MRELRVLCNVFVDRTDATHEKINDIKIHLREQGTGMSVLHPM
jgi:hypothetical protein